MILLLDGQKREKKEERAVMYARGISGDFSKEGIETLIWEPVNGAGNL